MPNLPQAFNDSTEGMNEFAVRKPGWYSVSLAKAVLKDCGATAKDPNGKYLSMHFKILSGKGKGSMFFKNINIINRNPAAVEMANKELNTFRKAINKPGELDTDEMVSIPLMVKVNLIPENKDKGWPAKNEIKMYAEHESKPISWPADAVSNEETTTNSTNDNVTDDDAMPWDSE